MDPLLTEMARQKVRDGFLPHDPDAVAYGGASHGSLCDLCSVPIKPGFAEIEINWKGATGATAIGYLYPSCYRVWRAAPVDAAVGRGSPGVPRDASRRG